MAYRIPRALAKRHPQYLEVMDNGDRPTLKGLTAAPWLPIASVEQMHEDPIVIPAGTWVGVTPTGATNTTVPIPYSGAFSTFSTGIFQTRGVAIINWLVPAAANSYRLRYTTKDGDTTFYTPAVADIDTLPNGTRAAGSAAGTSANHIGSTGSGIKPLGIANTDIYASWLGSQSTNYDRQPNIGFMSAGSIIQVPVVTVHERDINPGDVVYVDGFNDSQLIWDPSNDTISATGMFVGHLTSARFATFSTTAATGTLAGMTAAFQEVTRLQEFRVGRCLRKIKIAQGSSTGTLLNTYITSTTPTTANLNPEFRSAGRVQTVPGLSLQGSGTKGVPGHLTNARADANGDFWALEIQVSTI